MKCKNCIFCTWACPGWMCMNDYDCISYRIAYPGCDEEHGTFADYFSLYLDPPYVLSSRAGGLQYAKEMSDADHEKLLEVILDHPGPVVLSGYDSDLYRNMLKDWHRIELEGRTQSHARRTEVIWTNYIPPQAEQLTVEVD